MRLYFDIKYLASDKKVESIKCDVCSDEMRVSRNEEKNWSIVKVPRYDEFICPNAEEDWHDQAIELMLFIEKTPSIALENIVREELSAILELRKTTKKLKIATTEKLKL